MTIQTGDMVAWNRGNGQGKGKVTQIYTTKITKTIEGSDVTRSATDDETALLIEQKGGNQVLKSCTEVEKA